MKGAGAMSTMKPPSSPLYYVHEADGHGHHYLEECSLCGKSLSGDIFMYRSVNRPGVQSQLQCDYATILSGTLDT